MAVSTMIVISGYTFPALSTDLTLTRSHSTYELVYEKDLNLSTLPRPTYKDADDQEQTVDGSYRLSVNPTEVAADAKEKFVKVLFYPATGELPLMEEVLKINVHWYKRYPFIKGLVLPVPSTITSESLSITLTGNTDWGYKGNPCEITAEQILAANSGLSDDLVAAAGEMEYNGDAVPGVWSVLGASYDGVSGICSVQFKWVPEDNKSFATLTASVDMSVTDNRTKEIDLLKNLYSYYSFGNTTSFDGTDLSGNSHTLMQQNSYNMSVSSEGKFGSCVYAPNAGCGAYNDKRTIFQSNSSWSVVVWFKPISISEETRGVVRGSASGNDTGCIGIGLKNGKICICSNTKNEPYFVSEKGITEESGWHCFVLSHNVDNRIMTLYLDGENAGTWDSSGWNWTTNYNSSQALKVAWIDYNTLDACALGYYDEIGLWNGKYLSDKEINALWNNGSGLPFEEW